VIFNDAFILRDQRLKKQQIIVDLTACTVSLDGILECSVTLNIVGIWEFRVEYEGTRLKGYNIYAVINQPGQINVKKTLMLPMSFNVYEPYYAPTFGMGRFLKVDIDKWRPEYRSGLEVVYKLLMCDSYGNPKISQTQRTIPQTL
jgi:hypothetical protein